VLPSWISSGLKTLPLDVDGLLGELADPASQRFEVLPAGTVIGHVHLKVTDIPGTIAFYGDTLGFALMARLGGQAAFLAAGGYHHHLGANTWESAGAGAAPPGTASLRHATIVLASREERDRTAQRVREAGPPGGSDERRPDRRRSLRQPRPAHHRLSVWVKIRVGPYGCRGAVGTFRS
jgi:catechol 2,3-dioxygenase